MYLTDKKILVDLIEPKGKISGELKNYLTNMWLANLFFSFLSKQNVLPHVSHFYGFYTCFNPDPTKSYEQDKDKNKECKITPSSTLRFIHINEAPSKTLYDWLHEPKESDQKLDIVG